MSRLKWFVLLAALLAVSVAGAQTDDAPVIIGSFQSEIGCDGDWEPECDLSQLTDDDGNGVYSFQTTAIPAGEYEARLALIGTLEDSLGQDYTVEGDAFTFTVPESGQVTFAYSARLQFLNISVRDLAAEQAAAEASAAAAAEAAKTFTPPSNPNGLPNPDLVVIAGTVQSKAGCPGDWQPECETTALTYDPVNDVWTGSFDLPAGRYEYKAALNGNWDANYGLNAEWFGQNIPLALEEDATVSLFYDHKTGYVSDDVGSVIVTAPGSYQSQAGCSGDWQPDCLRSWLQDADGDGVYTLDLASLTAGDYEAKAAINRSWDVNYGADGALDGANIAFNVPVDYAQVSFSFDAATNVLSVTVNEETTGGPFRAGAAAVALQPQGEVEQPDMVVIPGTIQSVLGCEGDWDPACENTALVFDEADQVWQNSFDIPAGNYEYKVAINGSWNENYGGMADSGGPNVPLQLDADAAVKFYYDHATNWVADSVDDIIATAPGSYQDEIGCPGDWQPDCLRSWLQDPDGDGIYTFATDAIPAGDYEVKVAINESWDENYGVDGAPGGANIPFSVENDDDVVTFAYNSSSNILAVGLNAVPDVGASAPAADLSKARAHWVTADTIAWDLGDLNPEDATFQLVYSATGGLAASGAGVGGGSAITLTVDPDGLSQDVLEQFPHPAGYTALTIGEDSLNIVPGILKGQAAVAAVVDGRLWDATSLQIPGALDDLYTYDGPLGVTWDGEVPTLRVWAPTAQQVRLHLFDDASPDTEADVRPMTLDRATGVWSITGEAGWKGKYYLYGVKVFAPAAGAVVTNLVTDPYSFSLSMNSTRSQIVDLNDTSLKPEGWDGLQKPPLDAPEDIVIYELHIRDFSVNDTSVPEELKGTVKAFTLKDSNGMNHLRTLAEAGLTHLHLLPAFDIATINEDKSTWVEPDWDELAALPPDSEEQQAAVDPIRDQDAFNWGYDPFHYTVPEGSYSTDPNGTTRIVEFREMVQSLNQNGLRVVMDVVYNHTNASGQAANSVLDRIVPGYYHRLNRDGRVETSTCCQNTATEHRMMEKLMIDSVLTWATQYKVDGFRFDLMGHHMREDMENLRAALDSLTLEADGVDGRSIYVYGEGWDFGEVAGNARGVNATQFNMGGVGIGTFNDRLRDAVRGGTPFGDRQFQGFISGLYTDPNGITPGTPEEQLAQLLLFSDQIRVGLAGNLRDYRFEGASGETITGQDVPYRDSPSTGYTLDPQEQIVYISKHDNETLWDIILYKDMQDISMDDRVRMQNLGSSIVMLSQGVPFFQAGDDLLRSKSLDRNSYNSGDWFNKLDFTYQSNNFGVGLPPERDNAEQWPVIQPILANPDYQVTPEHIQSAMVHFREMLQIRSSSPLFRLRTADDVQERLAFLNTGPDQIPGLIVMSLSDTAGEDIDPNYDQIVVLFNGTGEELTFTADDLVEMAFELHPVQADSADAVVTASTFDAATGAFTVPARTAAVFVVSQSE